MKGYEAAQQSRTKTAGSPRVHARRRGETFSLCGLLTDAEGLGMKFADVDRTRQCDSCLGWARAGGVIR